MNVQQLLEAGANVSITMTPAQLKEFGFFIIDEVIKMLNSKKPSPKMTQDEVANEFRVTKHTLWRWAKLGYLVPVRCGRRLYYKRSEVLSLLDGDKCQRQQNCNVEKKGGAL